MRPAGSQNRGLILSTPRGALQPGLRLSGGPFCTFFNHYWDEIWRRCTALNPRGRNDLSMFEETAHRLGLPKHEWPGFLYGARTLEIGDGAPPVM